MNREAEVELLPRREQPPPPSQDRSVSSVIYSRSSRSHVEYEEGGYFQKDTLKFSFSFKKALSTLVLILKRSLEFGLNLKKITHICFSFKQYTLEFNYIL
ncbi:hypothetical protein HanIR_Chr09g0415501 [Helianthus annuus]|nr:hypothetical protein HanIR_Chr09g0415501 [Helianthus annuus]